MSQVIDISLQVRPGMPTWPDSVGIRLTRTLRLEAGDEANVSRLDCDVHVGTHVDAPWHFLPDGAPVEGLSLDALVGPCVVAHVPEATAITADVLDGLGLPPGTERLLFRTRNSMLWARDVAEFVREYVALTPDAASWVVARGIRLVGVDYLSVERYQDIPRAHRVLLGAGVAVVEGLNLADVVPGDYELLCLPLRLAGAEAAPARAVLRRFGNARQTSGSSD